MAIVECLIAQGVRMNGGNSDNQSALHVGANKGHLSIVKLLSENITFLTFM